ncbi:hypothetical protein LTR36_005723 [Oleoguttula mirabilis]|uniref:Uncharacterized protein n=1 Tax=Oleoguttula mirabilis TaxID=1507867 RepID=A0AAV9JD39_9PEZI|nr:hypothetical protein LTR36_005723 [Oleoguttula mirabilis]
MQRGPGEGEVILFYAQCSGEEEAVLAEKAKADAEVAAAGLGDQESSEMRKTGQIWTTNLLKSAAPRQGRLFGVDEGLGSEFEWSSCEDGTRQTARTLERLHVPNSPHFFVAHREGDSLSKLAETLQSSQPEQAERIELTATRAMELATRLDTAQTKLDAAQGTITDLQTRLSDAGRAAGPTDIQTNTVKATVENFRSEDSRLRDCIDSLLLQEGRTTVTSGGALAEAQAATDRLDTLQDEEKALQTRLTALHATVATTEKI